MLLLKKKKKKNSVERKDGRETTFLLLERLRFTFTANGKRQTQVEDLSE